MTDPAPLKATCLCRQVDLHLPTTLPRTAHACHCTTCRTSHGTLFCMHTDLDSLPFPIDSPPPTLKIYKDSKRTGSAYICTKCATWMFASYFYMYAGERREGCCVSTGCLYLSPEYKAANPTSKLEDVVSIDMHCLVKDTIDGGSASWAGDWSKQQVHFHGNWEEPPLASQQHAQDLLKQHSYPTGRKELDGWCKCQGVKVRIVREDETKKYKTILCACDSCRLATGTDIVPYTWVPRDKAFFVMQEDGQEKLVEWPQLWDDEAKAKFPSLVVYESTPGKIVWGGCGSCGCRIFYHRYDKEKDGAKIVEPLTGIFGADTTNGILHLDWFQWLTAPEGIWHMEDAEKEGRAGIISRNACEKYQAWVKELDAQ
ncbi:hypothetical protein H072_1592 [Dactylellina haptotyla CBS 200.50]|uniref:CENP-V/GFA domain-containing protein n=1 Tax=Dactylellina haptotyla (strain CBS 200.50) TaxID=1284197 RepID=S8AN94_DACHA|nr:hypothetical protein H072_1592 [Dactylellina haptotyla CBS 200.50]